MNWGSMVSRLEFLYILIVIGILFWRSAFDIWSGLSSSIFTLIGFRWINGLVYMAIYLGFVDGKGMGTVDVDSLFSWAPIGVYLILVVMCGFSVFGVAYIVFRY